MRTIQHWIAGSETTGASARYGTVWNPATGAEQARVALAEPADVDAAVAQITRDELTGLMAGGAELEQLSHELESAGGAAADIGRVMEEEAEELGIPHQADGGSDAASMPTKSGTTSQEGL
jgi:acyl-CoA reductase-like NAD-dependent aldehyde dehydrogenase